jgi:hypothetical protein
MHNTIISSSKTTIVAFIALTAQFLHAQTMCKRQSNYIVNIFNCIFCVFLLTFFLPNSGFSQAENAVKLSGGLSVSPFELQYERSLSPHFSAIVGIGLGATARTESGFLGQKVTTKYGGMNFSGEFRYYFSSKEARMMGWHIETYYEMALLKAGQSKVNITTFGTGGGYQFMLDKFRIDLLAGIGTFHINSDNELFGLLEAIPFAPRLKVSLGYTF